MSTSRQTQAYVKATPVTWGRSEGFIEQVKCNSIAKTDGVVDSEGNRVD